MEGSTVAPSSQLSQKFSAADPPDGAGDVHPRQLLHLDAQTPLGFAGNPGLDCHKMVLNTHIVGHTQAALHGLVPLSILEEEHCSQAPPEPAVAGGGGGVLNEGEVRVVQAPLEVHVHIVVEAHTHVNLEVAHSCIAGAEDGCTGHGVVVHRCRWKVGGAHPVARLGV